MIQKIRIVRKYTDTEDKGVQGMMNKCINNFIQMALTFSLLGVYSRIRPLTMQSCHTILDDHMMICDFDGSTCTLQQAVVEDNADWSIVKATETRAVTSILPATNDHTTDTGIILYVTVKRSSLCTCTVVIYLFG